MTGREDAVPGRGDATPAAGLGGFVGGLEGRRDGLTSGVPVFSPPLRSAPRGSDNSPMNGFGGEPGTLLLLSSTFVVAAQDELAPGGG